MSVFQKNRCWWFFGLSRSLVGVVRWLRREGLMPRAALRQVREVIGQLACGQSGPAVVRAGGQSGWGVPQTAAGLAGFPIVGYHGLGRLTI